MKLVFIILTISLLTSVICAQENEFIYTISAEIDGEKQNLDSILIENLTTKLSFVHSELPNTTTYVIDLNTNKFIGINSILSDNNKYWQLISNTAGVLKLKNQIATNEFTIAVYDIEGKLIFIQNGKANVNNVFELAIPHHKIYVVKIFNNDYAIAIRVFGSEHNESFNLSKVGTSNWINNLSKSYSDKSNDRSYFNIGDSIRVSVFKSNYYTFPLNDTIASSKSHVFNLNEEQVDETGISDAWFDISAYEYHVNSYNEGIGTEVVLNDNTSPIVPGNIIVLDIDTLGLLQKVVFVEVNNDSIIIKTTPVFR
ncbi:hypothetical protein [Carboxylicivirga caseinilyticus]|uniref:hypothetical protein n=1 Tax=Carboxylicivirga caseinilyticus TaxID=3417572 RepID=UPI003D34B8FC|nr:hypothetical protein [Marinilabiliaceae bacterium A049]